MSKIAVVFACAVGVASCGHREGPRSSLTREQAAAARQACQFDKGTLPGLSQDKDARLGTEIPIDTIVVVMLENKSFDHLLQKIHDVGQTDAEVAPPDASNVNPIDNMRVPQFHLTTYCFDDTSHGWSDVHTEWDNGLMDGFVAANNHNNALPADGTRAMGYYDENDLPWLYQAASTFALADHNFSPVLGPTYPNREYFYAATSFGRIGNELFANDMPTLFAELETAKVDWHIYRSDLPGAFIFTGLIAYFNTNVDLVDVFFSDARAGMLHQVNFVDPILGRGAYARNDFHPPGDVQMGQQFVARVAKAMMSSPQWPRSALIVTFDEHGGSFDHVKPPAACAPDAIAPITNPNDNAPGGFDQYGVRVPLLVISPYSKPRFVSHAVYDHTSITRFIETRFELPALTRRDANADPLTDLFDFTKPAFKQPPPLPDPDVDPAQLADCQRRYPDDMGRPTDL